MSGSQQGDTCRGGGGQRGCGLSCVGEEHSLADAVSPDRVSVIQDACQGLAVGHMYQKHKVLIPHCRAMKAKGLSLQM